MATVLGDRYEASAMILILANGEVAIFTAQFCAQVLGVWPCTVELNGQEIEDDEALVMAMREKQVRGTVSI